jgi:fatty-acyl-CoA synthase
MNQAESRLHKWIRALEYTKRAAGMTLPGVIDQLADLEEHANCPAVINIKQLTYRQLAHRMNGYAASAIDQRMAGRTVALLMCNSPEYVAIWLGLTRVRCTVALLNTNLPHDALLHCIRAAGADYLIGDDELVGRLASEIAIARLYDNGRTPDCPLPRPQDTALYIYTSGTTGLPKAVRVTHARIIEWSFWFAGISAATPQDRLYNCLPMYHSIGGVVAIGSMLVSGASVVIRQRFSVGRFWEDIYETRCTIFQYIGELCRYLILAPHKPLERKHGLRLAIGNGLQEEVWVKFQERFGIPEILEYYAATEGMLSLYNFDGKPGAVGQIPTVLQAYFGVKLIRIDEETGEPLRGTDGFCIETEIGLPGEAISLIRDRVFDGYHDADASNRKILTGVFAEEDRWFRTGDLMRRDHDGNYYFVDRLGDTFRWKGENVSTTEIANVLRQCPGVIDAVVYGVRIPGKEGRVGMAAMTTTDAFMLTDLAAHVDCCLPSYARPIFLRLCDDLDTTETFKLVKGRFAAEGYASSSDPVYVRRGEKFQILAEGKSDLLHL